MIPVRKMMMWAMLALLVLAMFGCKKKSDSAFGEQPSTGGNNAAGSTSGSSAQTAPALPPAQLDPAAAARVLVPPPGAQAAIIVFEDMQCPSCARNENLIVQTAQAYRIPVVRHDFVIPNHAWSGDAHLMARYFDTLSPQLGEEFRHYIFMNQTNITKLNLREMADAFAAKHGQQLPTYVDPSGTLKAKITADMEVGRSIGIHQTPTIYVTALTPSGPRYVELDQPEDLPRVAQQVVQQVGGHGRKGEQ